MDTTGPSPATQDAGGIATLERWLERGGKGALAKLARDSNIGYAQLWRYVKGHAVPQYPTAIAISAATGGEVSALSLVSRQRITRKPKRRSGKRRRAA